MAAYVHTTPTPAPAQWYYLLSTTIYYLIVVVLVVVLLYMLRVYWAKYSQYTGVELFLAISILPLLLLVVGTVCCCCRSKHELIISNLMSKTTIQSQFYTIPH
jgi:hypothetical protein